MKRKCLGTMVLSMLILFCAINVDAWWCGLRPTDKPIHEKLVMLSASKLKESGLYSEEALIAGVCDPDRNKGTLQSITHEGSFRARDTLCAAVKEYRNNKNLSMRRYWAIRRLARGFHYLADYADPSDNAGGNKNAIRKLAYTMLTKDKLWNTALWQMLLERHAKALQHATFDQTMEYGRTEALRLGSQMRSSRDGRSVGLMESFAVIKVCQDRMIDFFLQELGNGAAGICGNPQLPNPQGGQLYTGPRGLFEARPQPFTPGAPPPGYGSCGCFSSDGRNGACRSNGCVEPPQYSMFCYWVCNDEQGNRVKIRGRDGMVLP